MSIMLSWKIVLVNALFVWCCDAMLCKLENLKIICSEIEEDDLYTDIAVKINPIDVLDLTITNTTISSVNKVMFSKYKHLHTLSMENIQLADISENTFTDLNNLRNMKLSQNLLKVFDFTVFSNISALYILDLSQNNLESLRNFNADSFNTLTILNISHNNLRFLPSGIINKLKKDDTFYLVVDNNPWNCSEDEWSTLLDPILTAAFCAANITILQDEATVKPVVQHLNANNEVTDTTTEKDSEDKMITKLCGYATQCFSYCIFWFLGGIWLGVILGNICKLNKLFCASSGNPNQEQNTQYDKVDLRSKD